MADQPARGYEFSPLERRGVLLGLQGGQLGVLAIGALTAVLVGRAVPPPAGPGLALGVVVLAGVGAIGRFHGRPAATWVPVATSWLARRPGGPRLHAGPTEGSTTGRAAPVATRRARPVATRRVFRVTTTPDGIELLELAAGPGETPLGVLRDRRNGWLAAVLAVRGSSFALLDSDGQLRLFDGWRSVLGTMARAGTPVRRLQWVQVSEPAGDAGALVAPPERPGFEAAVASYRQLIDGAAPTVVRHDAFLVVAVSGGRRPGGPGGGPPDAEALRREVRLLGGQLRNADLGAGPALDLDGLFRLIGSRHAQPTGRRGPGWAMATDEAWSCLRVDGTWHATFWVAEWPRVAVGPDFLLPMLLGDGRRAMSVVMAPVPAERAARQARAARAADVADEELRSRAGFLPNARRNREADGVVRLEAELADGHAQYRFSGYVTVTAPDRAALEAACVETEQAAQAAHLELRRLYGRQAEAYTWTLPLCRGLA